MTAAFISYATEDKAIAQSLADLLLTLGLDVWFDDYVLTVGNSLKAKIDNGLSRCDYGIVILSEQFFQKRWPREELDGLTARETNERRKVVLPVWHKLTLEELNKFSPTLAGKVAVSTELGLEFVAATILRTIRKEDTAKLDIPSGKTEKHRELMRQLREGELSRLFAVGNDQNDFIVVHSRSGRNNSKDLTLQLRELIKELISGEDIIDNDEGSGGPNK